MKHLSAAALLALLATSASADDLDCVSTAFRIMGANDKVCVSAFDDEEVGGVTCYIAQARTGGMSGMVGLAEDPSRFSLSCIQTGPIAADLAKLPEHEKVYSEKTSVFFKHTKIYRIVDGSPFNAVASVPVTPWGQH